MGSHHAVVAMSLQTLGHILRMRQQLQPALEAAQRCESIRSASCPQAQGPALAAVLHLQVRAVYELLGDIGHCRICLCGMKCIFFLLLLLHALAGHAALVQINLLVASHSRRAHVAWRCDKQHMCTASGLSDCARHQLGRFGLSCWHCELDGDWLFGAAGIDFFGHGQAW